MYTGITHSGDEVVVEHEALGAQGVAAVAVEQRDHDRHVGATCKFQVDCGFDTSGWLVQLQGLDHY